MSGQTGSAVARGVLALGAASLAAPCAAAPGAPAWEPGFTFVPYGWLAGLDGKIGTGSDELPERIDVAVDEELEEIGFMFFGEWRGERWFAFFDSVWANVSQDGEIQAGMLPASDAHAGIDGNVYQLAAGYRLDEAGSSTFSLYVGGRYYDLTAEASFEGGLLPGRVTASSNASWTEGLVGLRWGYRLADDWRGTVLSDFGFGESDFTWQVFASVAWQFNEWGSLAGGYRYMVLDYESPEFRADLALTGPAIGVGFRF